MDWRRWISEHYYTWFRNTRDIRLSSKWCDHFAQLQGYKKMPDDEQCKILLIVLPFQHEILNAVLEITWSLLSRGNYCSSKISRLLGLRNFVSNRMTILRTKPNILLFIFIIVSSTHLVIDKDGIWSNLPVKCQIASPTRWTAHFPPMSFISLLHADSLMVYVICARTLFIFDRFVVSPNVTYRVRMKGLWECRSVMW